MIVNLALWRLTIMSNAENGLTRTLGYLPALVGAQGGSINAVADEIDNEFLKYNQWILLRKFSLIR